MWFKEIGYEYNPFHTKENPDVIDHGNVDETIELLKSLNWVLLSGDTGSGKSSTLLKVAKRLSKENIVIRINGKAISGEVLSFRKDYYEKALAKEREPSSNNNLYRKALEIFGFQKPMNDTPSKDVYVIIDELHCVYKELLKQIEGYSNERLVKAVVAAKIEDSLHDVDCEPTFERRFDNNKLKTKDLSEEDCLELIRKRLGTIEAEGEGKEEGEKVFKEDALRIIIRENNNIPYLILQDCMKICRHYMDKAKNGIITDTDVIEYYNDNQAKDIKEKPKEDKHIEENKPASPSITDQQVLDLGLNPKKTINRLKTLLYYKVTDGQKLARELGIGYNSVTSMLNRLEKKELVKVVGKKPNKKYFLTPEEQRKLAKK